MSATIPPSCKGFVPTNPTDEYAWKVLQGEVLAGKYHSLSCARHVRDRGREGQPDFPFVFSWPHALHFFTFAHKCRHYKGEWAGQRFVPSENQVFTLGCLFGWRTPDGLRRFTTAYNELARKQGKTFTAAMVALYVTFFEREHGAEGFCLHPDTRVLTADLRWVPLRDVQIGDELIGVDEMPPAPHTWRKMRRSVVLGKTTRRCAAKRITFENGLEVICSSDHQWLSTSPGANGRTRWRSIDGTGVAQDQMYVAPKPKRVLTRVTKKGVVPWHGRAPDATLQSGYSVSYFGQPWVPDDSREAGYLAGLFDGEGHIASPKTGTAWQVFFSQKPGAVYDACLSALYRRGYRVGKPHIDHGVLEIAVCGLYDCLRFLACVKPLRLFQKAANLWENRAFCNGPSNRLSIVSIADEPEMELLDIETTTHTFIAEGLVSHNCIATKRDQAKRVWDDCKRLVISSGLRNKIVALASNLNRPEWDAKLEPLGSDADSTDGLNPHLIVTDEFHAMKSRALIDVMETATGARRNPLHYQITTAGNDPVSPCGDQHDYATKVLEGIVPDEHFFAFIAHADQGDDWQDETTWKKANPHYGISVHPEDMRKLALKAKHMPAAIAQFKQKRLNEWVNTYAPSLSMDGWAAGQSDWDLASMVGEPCVAGVDLSSKIDLCALSLVFPPRGERKTWRVALRVWTPADTLRERALRDRAPYDVWRDHGWLVAVPGKVIDHDVFRDELTRVRGMGIQVQALGFDPWHADQLAIQLQTKDGWPEEKLIEIPQTYAALTSAETAFKAAVLSGEVDARRSPVAAWCASNVIEQIDGKGNLLFSKKSSRGRIDAIKATTIAWAVAQRQPAKPPSYDIIIVGGRHGKPVQPAAGGGTAPRAGQAALP